MSKIGGNLGGGGSVAESTLTNPVKLKDYYFESGLSRESEA